jgi:hypothetical protein
LPQVHAVNLKSSYHLTRGGEMDAVETTTDYRLASGEGGEGINVEAKVTGSPGAGRFAPHVKVTFPDFKDGVMIGPFAARDFERDCDAVAVAERGTVLNPLHPPRRFTDVRAGQHWHLTVIDPLALLGLVAPLDAARGDALKEAGVATGAGAYVLEARVLPGVQKIDWQIGKDVPCRVIRCDGEGPAGPLTYWVRESDGAVMRQEVVLDGDTWTFLRLPPGYPMRSFSRQRNAP